MSDFGKKSFTTSKSATGYLNRESGKNFEEYIELSLLWYEKNGLAVIEKTPEPMRPLSRLENGRFVACYEQKAQPDYKGTLKSGRSVVFEAKYTSDIRIGQHCVTDKQAERLEQHERMGAICFILVGFSDRSVYRVPWNEWKRMKEIYGKKSLRPIDIKEFQVPSEGVLKLLEGIM